MEPNKKGRNENRKGEKLGQEFAGFTTKCRNVRRAGERGCKQNAYS